MQDGELHPSRWIYIRRHQKWSNRLNAHHNASSFSQWLAVPVVRAVLVPPGLLQGWMQKPSPFVGLTLQGFG